MLEVKIFKAAWCSPCRAIAPMIEEVKKEMKSVVDIQSFDVDATENKSLIEKYEITSVPTLIFIKKGIVTEKLKGALTKTAFVKKIQSFL